MTACNIFICLSCSSILRPPCCAFVSAVSTHHRRVLTFVVHKISLQQWNVNKSNCERILNTESVGEIAPRRAARGLGAGQRPFHSREASAPDGARAATRQRPFCAGQRSCRRRPVHCLGTHKTKKACALLQGHKKTCPLTDRLSKILLFRR